MVLDAFSSRHYVAIPCIDEEFRCAVNEEQMYSFYAGFSLKDDNNGEIIALVNGTFFDEDRIMNEGESLVNVADMINGDIYGAISSLVDDELFTQGLNENKAMLPLFSCYIERVYIYPNYRNRGIASFVFNNLEQIFWHSFNTPIHCFVIYPKPQQPVSEHEWIDYPDDDGEMLKQMINVISKVGYQKLGDTGYYAINCSTGDYPNLNVY